MRWRTTFILFDTVLYSLYHDLRQTLFEKVQVHGLDLLSTEDGALIEYPFHNGFAFSECWGGWCLCLCTYLNVIFSYINRCFFLDICFLQALQIHYQGLPQQDEVKLHAEVHFPNLHFCSTTIDFGCVLNYTVTRKKIRITNCSPLPVSYCWTFLDDQKHNGIRYV